MKTSPRIHSFIQGVVLSAALTLAAQASGLEMAIDAAKAGASTILNLKPTFPELEIDPKDPFEALTEMAHSPTVNLPGMGGDGIPFSLRDAIAFSIDNQISIQLSALTIESQKGSLQAAASPFDYYVTSAFSYKDQNHLLNSPKAKTNKRGSVTAANAGVTKLTRPGTAFNLTSDVNKAFSPLNDDPKTVNNGNITFSIDQPLLKGFLNSSPYMQEQAAKYSLFAAYYDDFQTMSQSILDTTNAYWAAVAAQNILEIQEVASRRSVDLADRVNQLIKNDELARSSFYQIQQQESTQKLALIGAADSLYNAVQDLRLTMGDVSVESMCDIMFDLTDDFAIQELNICEFQKQFKQYFEFALKYSFDIQSSTLKQTVAAYNLKGADNDCLPVLNFKGEINDTNFTVKYAKELLSPLWMVRPQENWTLSARLEFPIYNDGAIGAYRQQKAAYSQAMLNTQLLQEQKLQDLRKTLSQQIILALRLKEANQNVEISKTVYDNSLLQFNAGISTLFDLLSYEGSLTSALVDRTGIKQSYMQNIARIRFLTASTFLQGDDLSCIEILDMTTLPEFDLPDSDRPKMSPRMEKFLQRRDKVWKKR